MFQVLNNLSRVDIFLNLSQFLSVRLSLEVTSIFFFLQSMLYSLSFAGTLNMKILCFRDVEHPKVAQFASAIKNQIF